jgi:hypothetical protein
MNSIRAHSWRTGPATFLVNLHGGSEHERPTSDSKQVCLPERTDLVDIEKKPRPENLRRYSDAGTSGCHANKTMAYNIKESADVWDLERYSTQRRKDIDRRYELRSSRLTQVFGMLLSERRILKNNCAAYAMTS